MSSSSHQVLWNDVPFQSIINVNGPFWFHHLQLSLGKPRAASGMDQAAGKNQAVEESQAAGEGEAAGKEQTVRESQASGTDQATHGRG